MDTAKEEPVALKPRENLTIKIPPLDGPPITIAVYGFQDKTGQMKPNDRLAVFSKAVTQGAEVFLIKSLQDSKNWFKVVERVGLDNLIKERQLIRNQREVYEGKDAKPLKPMTVAGVMIEGGIIGYDSNIRSGGNGARFLGIGGSQQYRVDEIVISLRLISVNSGEVLLTNAVSKTIYSTQGQALNEPTTYAVRVAIEQAVYDMIVEGEKKGLWRYKVEKPAVIEEKKDQAVVPQAPISPQPPITVEPVKQENTDPEQKVETAIEKISRVVPVQPPQIPVIEKKADVEEKVDQPTVVITQPDSGKTSTPLWSPRYLKQDSFVYKEPDEKSQRTWQLKKGTEFNIISPGPEGWHYVTDAEKRKGYVRTDVLSEHKP